MTEISDEEKKKLIAEKIESSDLPQEAKEVGIINALMGMSPDAVIQSIISAANSAAEREAEKAYPRREFIDYNPVEKKIAEMLTENTGVHMMDSGGIDSRHWQQNRKVVDFRTRPEIQIDLYVDEPSEVEQENHMKRQTEVPYNQKKLVIENEEAIQVPHVSLQMTPKPPILKIPKIVKSINPQNNIPIPIEGQPKKKQIKAEDKEKERLRA